MTALRFLLGLSLIGTAHAQVPSDSLTHYELGEIVVSPEGESIERSPVSTVQRVRLAGIAQADAPSIDVVLRQLPSAHVQTNSRGETLVYLRGAGERQVGIFFDGALLNVPWDNRVDLSMIPSEVVGDITVVKGVPSVLYGANVLGGAINLTSRELRNEGSYSQLSAILGSHNSQQARITWLRRSEHFQSTFFGGVSDEDGFAVPRDADLPFGQAHGTRRSNTDRSMRSGFGQVAYHGTSGASIGLSVLSLGGRKGVAPEGHLNPAVSNVRYWRYPNWSTNMAIISGHRPTRFGSVRGAVWYSQFRQSIAQYTDHTFIEQARSQRDLDDTFGTRLTLLRILTGAGTIRGAVSVLTSRHLQHDQDSGRPIESRTYSQHIGSAGIEYIWSGRLTMVVGASFDIAATPRTGDKPPRSPQHAYGVTLGVSREVGNGVTLRGTTGRKVRFPTMRELFGEALGRFLVNPALQPESSLLSEAALRLERGESTGEVVAFFNRTYDTIGQRVVKLEPETRPQRQRVNLNQSRVRGLEASLSTRILRTLNLNCSLTVMRAREMIREGNRSLPEKPDLLGGCGASIRPTGGFSVRAESVFTGRAYGLDDDNELVALPKSAVLNTRLAWLVLYNRYAAEFFARVNNLADAVTLTQLGLPGPGRMVHAGLQVSY